MLTRNTAGPRATAWGILFSLLIWFGAVPAAHADEKALEEQVKALLQRVDDLSKEVSALKKQNAATATATLRTEDALKAPPKIVGTTTNPFLIHCRGRQAAPSARAPGHGCGWSRACRSRQSPSRRPPAAHCRWG